MVFSQKIAIMDGLCAGTFDELPLYALFTFRIKKKPPLVTNKRILQVKPTKRSCLRKTILWRSLCCWNTRIGMLPKCISSVVRVAYCYCKLCFISSILLGFLFTYITMCFFPCTWRVHVKKNVLRPIEGTQVSTRHHSSPMPQRRISACSSCIPQSREEHSSQPAQTKIQSWSETFEGGERQRRTGE